MAHVDNLRRYVRSVRNGVYLNTATIGLLPDAVADAMKQALEWQVAEGRNAEPYFAALAETQAEIRTQLAHLFHAEAGAFALTESTTHGFNIVLNGLTFNPGDEIVVTNLEHSGALLPVFLQKQRRGVVVRVMDGMLPMEQFCQELDRLVTPRTRLIVCSHVSYVTGHRLPLEQIVRYATERSILVAVDGAQGAFAEELNLTALGADFYAFPGQKWLSGPDATGALYVRPGCQSLLQSTYVGPPTLANPGAWSFSGTFLSPDAASRLEHTFAGLIHWRGFLEALRFLRVQVGLDYAFSRIHGLSGKTLDGLLDLDRVDILTPREARVGLVHFRLKNMTAEAFAQEAKMRGIEVRAFAKQNTIRVSPSWYNSDDDIQRLIQLVTSLS